MLLYIDEGTGFKLIGEDVCRRRALAHLESRKPQKAALFLNGKHATVQLPRARNGKWNKEQKRKVRGRVTSALAKLSRCA